MFDTFTKNAHEITQRPTLTRQYSKYKHIKRSTKEIPPWNGQ